MSTSTTFKVSDVKVARVTNLTVAGRTVDRKNRISICSGLRAYERNHCSEVLMETAFSSLVLASRNNGFIRTVIDCYNNHHNLVIRPDDIWTAILTQFSFYINKNAEEFRRQFVNYEKKELVVKMSGTLRAAPYSLFVTLIKEKIDENLANKTVKDWILPNFTTTTTNDIISCGVVFMAVTKKCFDYVNRIECGIPYITLEGTLADWEDILNRLEKLKSYKLEKWYDLLKPILGEFVAAKKNEANVEFWNRICYYFRSDSGPSLITGWLNAFAVFNEYGQDCVDLETRRFSSIDQEKEAWPIIEVPSGSVTVNVKIVDDVREYNSIMFAGHIAYEVLEDDFTLQPQIGWGIALKSTAEEVEKLHETARGNGDFKCDACKVFFEE